MKSTVAELGYRPKIAPSRVTSHSQDKKSGKIPEPIATAIIKAGKTNKLVFVDFYAEWCGACKILDRTTFKDPSVIKAFEDFVFLKVDADKYPDALRYFNVVGMPTLIVLNVFGEEIYRQVGPIGAEKLRKALLLVRNSEDKKHTSD